MILQFSTCTNSQSNLFETFFVNLRKLKSETGIRVIPNKPNRISKKKKRFNIGDGKYKLKMNTSLKDKSCSRSEYLCRRILFNQLVVELYVSLISFKEELEVVETATAVVTLFRFGTGLCNGEQKGDVEGELIGDTSFEYLVWTGWNGLRCTGIGKLFDMSGLFT